MGSGKDTGSAILRTLVLLIYAYCVRPLVFLINITSSVSMGSGKDTGSAILRTLVLLIYAYCVRPLWFVWELLVPVLTPIIDIYNTIDFDNLDVLYVLQAFLKWYLMVLLYMWQWVEWGAGLVIDLTPGGRWLLDEVRRIIDQVDYEYRFLLKPLSMGLFSRKRIGVIEG